MGGKETFVTMLDSVFTVPPIFDESYYNSVIHEIREMQIMNMGNYAHGNQPIQHMIYMYDWAGEPWKTQYWVRQTMDRMYTPNPDGYCGDEDNGQTSAWYVFSALGFYPVCPGSQQYALGAPLFKSARINLENGNTVTINAPANSDENVYVGKLTVNGHAWDKNYLEAPTLKNGAVLDFTMQPTPDTERGTKADDVPYSFSSEK
ncbi:MAG: glycoside hydrolase family 92 protein, partial [Muribaculaceae bacterium]|nr:glycoside hydrolase family 92 protein [Muribaculaceae bacterium]